MPEDGGTMGRRGNSKRFICAAGLFTLAMSATAQADSPPPGLVDLVEQPDEILLLEFTGVTPEGLAKAAIRKVFKGNLKEKELTLDLMAGTFEGQGKEFMSRIKRGVNPAMMFSGEMEVEGMDMAGGGSVMVGFLYYGDQDSLSRWISFRKNDKSIWEFDKVEDYLFSVWAGGTDMLVKAVSYILSDPDPYIPTWYADQVAWKETIRIGKFEEKGTLIRSVDLEGNGKPDMFVANAAGDRVIRFNGKSFDDVTEKLGLQSASAVWTWGDVNADGNLDLVSWDGKGLSIHTQKADGTFGKKAVGTAAALAGGCASLAVLDLGERGHGMVLAGTRGMPMVLTVAAAGVKAELLAPAASPAKDLGPGGICLAADFDGDGILDVVQLFERGGYFYRGTGKGRFAAPVETAAATGPGRNAVCLGDFDGDGLPDILGTAEDKCRVWQNEGAGKFTDLLQLSGEIVYVSKPGGVDVAVGDVNNDGRQDVFLAYAGIPTQGFLNQGFRSLIQAADLDVDRQMVPGSKAGQQSACLADFNGDGTLDLALALKDGTTWLVTREPGRRTLGVTVALPPGENGPLKVVATTATRRLGAWMVHAGDPGVLIGARKAGPLSIEWTFPDGRKQKKDVIINDLPLRLVVDTPSAPAK